MKRCKQGDDLISELPDCVLGYIVSLLNIKDAIKTSVLCRRWRSIFTHRMELDINCTDIYDDPSELRFTSFKEYVKYKEELIRRVDQLIKLFRGKNIISLKMNFNLSISSHHSSHINEWFDFAAECGVKKLELISPLTFSFPKYWVFSEPRTSRLEYLDLKRCLVNPPSDFRGFRHLKTFLLNNVHFDKDFAKNLCFACPQLERLTLSWCRVDSNYLKITGPSSLRHLKVLSRQRSLMIEVCSMDLVTFEYTESSPLRELSLGEFPRLEKLFAAPLVVPRLVSMSWTFPHMEILGLCLEKEQVMEFPERFATLRNLKQLNLFVSSKSCKMELYRVLSLVKASPLLQKLVVVARFASNQIDEDKRSEIGGQCTTLGNHRRLKEFQLRGCVGLSYEIEFAIHVLRMAINLEQMVIGPSYTGDGNWDDRFKLCCSEREASWYQSSKDWMAEMLHDYIPPNLRFVML